VGQQLTEQLVALQEAEQVQRAVLGGVALGLLLGVHPVDGRFEGGPVVLGQDVAQEKKALLVEFLAVNLADRLVTGQAAIGECSSHVLPFGV